MTEEAAVLVAYLIAGGAFIFAGTEFGGRKLETIISSPLALFCQVYGALWFIVPVLTVIQGEYWWQPMGYSNHTMWIGLGGFFVFGLAAVAVASSLRRWMRANTPDSDESNWDTLGVRELLVPTAVVLAIALVGFAALGYQILSAGGFAQYLVVRNAISTGTGIIQLPLPWFGYLSVLFIIQARFMGFRGQEARWVWAGAIALLLLAVAVGALQGSRTRMLQPVLIAGLAYLFTGAHRGIPSLAKIGMAAAAVLLLGAGMILGTIRESLAGGKEMEKVASGGISTEAYREFENSWWLIENTGIWDQEDGKTIAAGFLFPVPRALWPEKPIGSGGLMVNLVRPRSIVDGIESTRSPVTTGMPTEGMLNFGLIGFPLVGGGFGLLVAGLEWTRRRIRTALGAALWLALLVRMLDGLNMEFFGFCANLLFAVTPFAIFWVVMKLVEPKGALARPPEPVQQP